jgi:alcohol dehydrogenase class IV
VPDSVQLRLPSNIVIRGGCSESLGEVTRGIGLTRVLLVTDPYMFDEGPVKRLVQRLEAAGVDTAVYTGVQPDPTDKNVEEALSILREHSADGVVNVGGGSPIDAAKAVAAMATNEGAISDYAGYDRFERVGLPIVAVPTTAGSGSEVTRATVITDTKRNVKMAIYDDILMPQVALVDYRLTMTMPRDLTAHVGIDSLVHAVEAYVSRLANVFSDMYALEAAHLIGRYLRTAFHEPDNEAAREAMMFGATLAGMAFSNSSVALVHGMSRPIGAHFHVTHGLSNALLFPAVTRFSLDAAHARYATIAREMGLADYSSSDEEAVGRLLEELEALNEELEIPSLRDLGLEPDRFESVLEPMAEDALASGSPDFNPRQPSKEEIVELYREVYYQEN